MTLDLTTSKKDLQPYVKPLPKSEENLFLPSVPGSRYFIPRFVWTLNVTSSNQVVQFPWDIYKMQVHGRWPWHSFCTQVSDQFSETWRKTFLWVEITMMKPLFSSLWKVKLCCSRTAPTGGQWESFDLIISNPLAPFHDVDLTFYQQRTIKSENNRNNRAPDASFAS